MLKTFGIAAAVVLGGLSLASPAHATANLFCEGEGAWLDALMGRLIVVNILGAQAEIGGKVYSTGPDRGEGEPFIVGQAFGEPNGDNILIDFVDPGYGEILVGLRAIWDDKLELWTGTMTSGDVSVNVTCDMG